MPVLNVGLMGDGTKVRIPGTPYRNNTDEIALPSGTTRKVAESPFGRTKGHRISIVTIETLLRLHDGALAGVGRTADGTWVMELEQSGVRVALAFSPTARRVWHSKTGDCKAHAGQFCSHVTVFAPILSALAASDWTKIPGLPEHLTDCYGRVHWASFVNDGDENFEGACADVYTWANTYLKGCEVSDYPSSGYELTEDLTAEAVNRLALTATHHWTNTVRGGAEYDADPTPASPVSTPIITTGIPPRPTTWERRDDLDPEEQFWVESHNPGEYVPTGNELEIIMGHIALMRALGRPINILLKGAPGTAKTTLAHYLGYLLNTPVLSVSCHYDVTGDQLLGINSADGWQDGAAPAAMRRGFILNLEEVNTARPGALVQLNSVLADTRFIELPDCPDPALRYVKADPRFIVIATMNEGAEFLAAKPMDPALRSRWSLVLTIEELHGEQLKAFLKRRTLFTDDGILDRIIAVYDQLKDAALQGVTSYSPTLRLLMDWAAHCHYWDPYEAAQHTVISRLSTTPEEVEDVENILQTQFTPSTARLKGAV